jgi:hypothetical protein
MKVLNIEAKETMDRKLTIKITTLILSYWGRIVTLIAVLLERTITSSPQIEFYLANIMKNLQGT